MILVYGATGTTGTLVATKLIERGLPVILSGRDRRRLERLASELDSEGAIEIREAHVHRPETLDRAMDGAALVINCAGPFTKLGEPVIEAAIRSGCHYLDTTGEQAFMRTVYERYESAARRASVVVINAFAFEVALGDWGASLTASRLEESDHPFDSILIAYAVDRFWPTRGTRASAAYALAGPACEWNHDRWEETQPGRRTRAFSFPEPFGERETLSFPSGEVITVPRHIHTHQVAAYISLLGGSEAAKVATKLASLVGPALPSLMNTPLGAFARAQLSALSSGGGRPHDSRFALHVEATRQFERASTSITGNDLYELTAAILAYGAARLIDDWQGPVGVLTPAEAFDAGDALQTIAQEQALEVTH